MLPRKTTPDAHVGFLPAGHARELAARTVVALALAAGWGSVATAAQGSASAADSVTTSIAHARVSGTTASVKVTCHGTAGAKCKLKLTLSVTETVKGGKVVGVSATTKKTHKVVVLAT